MSEMAPEDAHDELMCSMDVVAEVQNQDAEREQQREGVSVGCATRVGDGVDGSGSEAARALEGDDSGSMGREGFDGAEQGALTEAREAGGSDEDEVIAGKENASLQRAEGGGGASAGIKKGKRRRGKQKGTGHRQWMAAKGADLRPAAGEASVS